MQPGEFPANTILENPVSGIPSSRKLPGTKRGSGPLSPDPRVRLYKSYWNEVLLERITDEQTACNQHYARTEYPEGRGAASRAGEYTP